MRTLPVVPTTSLVVAESDELFTVFRGPVFTAGQGVPSFNELVPLVFYIRDDGETGGMVAARRRRVLELQAPALGGDRGYQDAAQRDPRGGQHLDSVQKPVEPWARVCLVEKQASSPAAVIASNRAAVGTHSSRQGGSCAAAAARCSESADVVSGGKNEDESGGASRERVGNAGFPTRWPSVSPGSAGSRSSRTPGSLDR